MSRINNITNFPDTGLYKAAQVRAMDRYAIDRLGILGLELMHRAGQSAFDCLQRLWPDVSRLTVVCGAGNNAGDGYVVARLAKLAGMQVTVMPLVPPEKLSGDAATVYQEFIGDGGRTDEYDKDQFLKTELIIDALLGTGLDRKVTGLFSEAITSMNSSTKPVLALDIPSGLNADTGHPMGCAVRADCTISFIGRKKGLYTGEGLECAGLKEYSSLSVPDEVIQSELPSAQLIVPAWHRLKPRNLNAHKGRFGHVLIVGGDAGYSGAALLAATSAARVGAGLISVATRSSHAPGLNLSRPELMCHGIESVDELAPLLAKASVVAIGPGLGQTEWARDLLAAVLSASLPTVVDADALNLLANLEENRDDWVLTPHPGEAARLLRIETSTVNTDRFDTLQKLQQKFGGVCILKGAGTLISDGDQTHISTTGNPGMATGGMGDVLTGVIAGLIAQGIAIAEATRIGVYVHGEAADQAAHHGQRGLLASDLFPYLRELVNP